MSDDSLHTTAPMSEPEPSEPEPTSDHPEHDKLNALSHKAHAIGLFLRWMLVKKQWLICYEDQHGDPQRVEDSRGVDALIADILTEYFGIDRRKLRAENQAMTAVEDGNAHPPDHKDP